MKRYNLHSAETSFDEDDPEGYKTAYVRVGPEIGATMLGATIYDLPAGQSICPYHYEYGNEEWLLVLDGRPILRHHEGEEELAAGDAVSFPIGPEGAHKVTNRTDAPVRVIIFSTKNEPSVAVYPDSDKIGVWPGDKRDHILVRRESVVDYWDRET